MGDDSSSSASSSSSSSPASYIRMVQHLIEKCLLFNMNKEECVDALEKHADIKPVITSTVWRELEKENEEFFAAYMKERVMVGRRRIVEAETDRRIQKMLSDAASRKIDDDDDDDDG